jgi:hypothetical protein
MRSLLALLLALALALASTASAATRILAVGDYGVGGTSQQATGDAMRLFEESHPADLLVTLGDNDYTESPSAFHRNWTSSFGWLEQAGVRVAGTLGNHDYAVDGGRHEFQELGMPRRYYTRRAGPVELFLLDSNVIDDAQTAWLARKLSESTAAWKVAVFHHAPYVCGYHSGDSRVRREWQPLFERHGVQLVLSGHEHSYQRFAARNGVTYVVHGGGGSVLYPPSRCPSSYPERLFSRYAFGFLSLSASDDALVVSAFSRSLERVDRITLSAS